MSFKGKVILLTGAAGTGKSTLAACCEKHVQPLYKVDFGSILLDAVRAQGHPDLTYEQLRASSETIVNVDHVRAADTALIEKLPSLRTHTHVLVDSHAVTRQIYGYRITHYSLEQVKRIAFDVVLTTYCDPNTWIARHASNPQGRPALSPFEVQHHIFLQEAIALTYAVACGCPCYALDTTFESPDQLSQRVHRLVASLGGS